MKNTELPLARCPQYLKNLPLLKFCCIILLFTLLLSACTSPADDSTPVVKKEDSSKPLQTIEGLPQSLELDFQESY